MKRWNILSKISIVQCYGLVKIGLPYRFSFSWNFVIYGNGYIRFTLPVSSRTVKSSCSLFLAMVGYDPKHEVQLTATEHALAGAASGAVTRSFLQPLDVLKIRFQLQVEPISKTTTSKYWGVYHAVRKIVGEEGWRALWKGHVPAQSLSVVYGVAQYASFEAYTKFVWEFFPEDVTVQYRPVTHLFCGGLAGCTATVFTQPLDVLRTRFVAQGEPKIYKTLGGACISVWRHEGVLGFYKGLIPALTLIAPQISLQFGLYTLFTSTWNNTFKSKMSSVPDVTVNLICGCASGFFSKLFVYPLDVVKKRLQVQGFEEARKSFGSFQRYQGLTDCFIKVLRTEGARGLYKGLAPSLLKSAATTGFNFCIYDEVIRFMRLRHS